jgi:Flp pilus assembly protein TadD
MDGVPTASPDFIDLRTRAELLELCGDADGARRLEQRSLEIAREVDLVCYAYQLMWRNRVADAIDLLRHCVEINPESWNAHHSLGEALEMNAEYSLAAAHYRAALLRIEDREQRQRIEKSVGDLLWFH